MVDMSFAKSALFQGFIDATIGGDASLVVEILDTEVLVDICNTISCWRNFKRNKYFLPLLSFRKPARLYLNYLTTKGNCDFVFVSFWIILCYFLTKPKHIKVRDNNSRRFPFGIYRFKVNNYLPIFLPMLGFYIS